MILTRKFPVNDKQQNLKSKESYIMASKNLQGTIEYYIKGQYGLIKGEDGKEYCFGRKAVTARAKLFNGDVVRFTVDQKHHILVSKVTSYVAVRSKIRKALANKGYSFQSEKGGKWSIIVKNGDRKMILEEYGHMTLLEVAKWVKTAKKLNKEDIDKMFEKNTEKSNVKNDDCKIGGHVVPDDMAKNFGVPDDGTDIPVKKSLEEAASEADVKVDTEIIHVHRYFA